MIPFTHMKRFYVIMSALLLTLMGTEVLAQKKDSNSDYNLQKAYEVLKEEKDEAKALDLVSQQLSDTPDNIDALILRVRLLRRKEDYGRALSDINHALKVNKPKKSGTPASTLHWWKAYIYMDMGEKRKSSERVSPRLTAWLRRTTRTISRASPSITHSPCTTWMTSPALTPSTGRCLPTTSPTRPRWSAFPGT